MGCVKELLVIIYKYWNSFGISIRPENHVKEPLKKGHKSWNLFLIIVRPERCVKELLVVVYGRWNFFRINIKPKRAVERDLCTPNFVLDWFVIQEQVKILFDDSYYCNDNKIVEWYEDYKNHKPQKVQIKKKLMLITWHLSRWCNWCVPEDEKKETEELWKQLF